MGDAPAWPWRVHTSHLPQQRGRQGGEGMGAELTLVTVLRPLLCRERGCLPHHWGEVGRRQVACLVAGLTLSAGGERERGPLTTGG
jgi:hypothetical protein